MAALNHGIMFWAQLRVSATLCSLGWQVYISFSEKVASWRPLQPVCVGTASFLGIDFSAVTHFNRVYPP